LKLSIHIVFERHHKTYINDNIPYERRESVNIVGLFAYRMGVKTKRSKKDRRILRDTLVADASGQMGEGGILTVIVTVVKDPAAFGDIRHVFPKSKYEVKFYNSDHETRKKVLTRIADCDTDICHITYSMAKLGVKTTEDRKEHYIMHMRDVLDKALTSKTVRIVDMIFDNDMISKDKELEFVGMCMETAKAHNKEAYWVEMVDSGSSPLVSVNDFITGTIARHLCKLNEPDDEVHELYEIIKDKIMN